MSPQCPHCGARLRTNSETGAQTDTTCWMCNRPIHAATDPAQDVSPPTIALRRKPLRTRGAVLIPQDGVAPTTTLTLPAGKRVTISVLAGKSQGTEFAVSR